MTEETDKPSTSEDNLLAAGMPLGLPTGIMLGVMFGLTLDNLAIGISLGVAFGVSLSLAFGSARIAAKKKSQEAEATDASDEEKS